MTTVISVWQMFLLSLESIIYFVIVHQFWDEHRLSRLCELKVGWSKGLFALSLRTHVRF